jgi:hypothetical protein
MNKKTYADNCLKLAKKATDGPWYCGGGSPSIGLSIRQNKSQEMILWVEPLDNNLLENVEFIGASRTMVPKLSIRLKKAIAGLRAMNNKAAMRLADELEKG